MNSHLRQLEQIPFWYLHFVLVFTWFLVYLITKNFLKIIFKRKVVLWNAEM